MKFFAAPDGAPDRVMSLPRVIALCLLLTLTPLFLAAAPTAGGVGTILRLPTVTVVPQLEHRLVVNGSFIGENLSYRARLEDGSALPAWISVDAATGTLSISAPESALNQLYNVRVIARDPLGNTGSMPFDLFVGGANRDCIDANADRLARVISCAGASVKLRGNAATGTYRWVGPDGWRSSDKNPTVSRPGTYVLLPDAAAACSAGAAVNVTQLTSCPDRMDNNRVPVADFTAEVLSTAGGLTVALDASSAYDPDGRLMAYEWTWEGGTATGPTPVVTFRQSQPEVALMVTDLTGARAVTRIVLGGGSPVAGASDTHWLEAECATVGNAWTTVESGAASGGTYVKAMQSSMTAAPAAVPENLVRFTIADAKAGNYRLLARLRAPDGDRDSYYVRINGGGWYAWKSGIIKSTDFHWNEMPQQLSLAAGTNVLEVAFRERGTGIDKFLLTTTSLNPSGMGEADPGCSPLNEAPVAVAAASAVTGVAPLETVLDGTGSRDFDGSLVAYQWKWAGGSATGSRARVTFPAGTHAVSLTVTDDGGLQDTDIVTVKVTEPSADATNIWLEAECAAVGSRWSTKSAGGASGGRYVVREQGDASSAPPSDVAENRVRFQFSAGEAGSYRLFARVNVPTKSDDSFWVRINGGGWYKWYNGMPVGQGFAWAQVPMTVTLNAGANTVDFAFREDGSMLDKLHLTRSGSLPTGTGAEAGNCGGTTTPDAPTATDVAVEAECGEVGTGWSAKGSASTSNGQYLVFEGDRSLAPPVSETGNDVIGLDVDVPTSGTHKLFVRMNAPDPSSNSLYVKVDDGDWLLFWKHTDGSQILTSGFEWVRVTDDGTAMTFDLDAGHHTVWIGHRETGTGVDKVAFTTGATPSGYGPAATGCGGSSQSMGGMTGFARTGDAAPAPEAAAVELFPNPVLNRLNVNLHSAYRGDVVLQVFDLHGRAVLQRQLRKDTDAGSATLRVGSLPRGVYQLRVIEGDRMTSRSFVKR